MKQTTYFVLDAIRKGSSARMEGWGTDANPFPSYSPRYQAWKAGWIAEEMERAERQAEMELS